MGILIQFLQDFKQWEKSSQWALGLAFALMGVVGAIALTGQESLRTPSLVGLIGLGIVAQGIVLWGNRHLVTDYTQAQRAFLEGDFNRVKMLLEAMIARSQTQKKPISADVYVLLGNAYRQLGDLVSSEHRLRIAVTQNDDYAFALYGLGRTFFAMGNYQEAVTTIMKSLRMGAPSVVQFDLGHVAFRAGQIETAKEALKAVLTELDTPARTLMAHHILNQCGETVTPLSPWLDAGLPFWAEEASRFAQTPYGEAITQDVLYWQGLS